MRHGRVWVGVLIAAGLGSGCKKTEVASRDLDTLMHDLYRDYGEPEAASVDIVDLEGFLLGEGRTETASEGYTLSDLEADDVAGVTHPDRSFDTLVGAAVGYVSAFPPEDHAVSALEPDQVWNDPKSLESYQRAIVSGDTEAFSGGAGLVSTTNDIIKSGAFGVTVPYTLMKDYRWVTASEGRDVLLARSWIEERGCSDNGKNCVEASYSLEIFYPDPEQEGQTIRLTVAWIDLVTEADSLLSEESRLDLLVNGQNDIFEAMDAHLAGTED